MIDTETRRQKPATSNEAPSADLTELATLIRYFSLTATTKAGSGHPTSSLSATELMAGLMFGGTFRYDVENPQHPNNDRLIFSKGHASPLFYSLWLAAGQVTEKEMMTYRQFGSRLEGHPTVSFPHTVAATGSLGQGLAIGVGLAINAKYLDQLPYRTYVLLGDSEMAEGSQWEALGIAAHYQLDNLVGIIDVNRLGQRGPTMFGHDLEAYRQRVAAFGWETILVDGHSFDEILAAYETAAQVSGSPVMIIAKTIKGKGVSFLEDKNGWHGKTLDEDQLKQALEELGEVNKSARGTISAPEDREPNRWPDGDIQAPSYKKGDSVATRDAYGNALKRIYPKFPDLVSLDGEVGNSTRAAKFGEEEADHFFEMFIAEQNMAGTALGLSCGGKIPFASSFAAFLTRAFDQIRMSQYSDANIKFVGSHAGVSIGADGPSQMGLEDIAMFRTIHNGVVLYPSDALSADKLIEAAAAHQGMVYLRTTRGKTPVIYDNEEEFQIGGSKVLRQSQADLVTVISAGITLHEALKAADILKQEGMGVRVIDLYSIKPLDQATLEEAANATQAVLTVEDHYPEGGLGEAVKSALAGQGSRIHSLAVRRKPKSGKPAELLDFEEISSAAIIAKVKQLVGTMKA